MTNADRQQLETLQDRYGLRVAARLSMGTQTLPHDVTERLKAARMQALARRRVAVRAPTSAVLASGNAAALGGGDESMNFWSRLAAVLPLIVLVLGLVTIHWLQNERVAGERAALDAALLVDDLPPAAYADPGFARFVQLRRRQAQ